MKRLTSLCLATMAAFALSVSTALAGPQSMASGGGQTHLGASLGFNAKDDQSGDFNYVGTTAADIIVSGSDIPAGSSFHGHCFDYTAVNFVSATQARLFAACRGDFFVNGGPPIEGTVYLQAHVIDNGEPGFNDRACIAWGLNKNPGKGDAGLFVFDCGKMQTGNIQVH